MVDDSVNHGGELLVAEHGASFPERDVGCEYYAAAPIACRYHLKQLSCDLDVEWHVAELVEYDQGVACQSLHERLV